MEADDLSDERPREPFFGRSFFAYPAASLLPFLLIGCFIAQLVVLGNPQQSEATLTWALSGQALHQGRWWTLFTHMFLHVGWLHVGMNTAVALSVSTPVAFVLGRGVGGFIKFYVLYLLCGVIAALTYLVLSPDSTQPMIGASGAISGLWGAMVRVPQTPGRLDPPWSSRVLRMSAPFILINVVAMAVLERSGVLPVAWQAHLGGFVAGLALISVFAMRPRPMAGPWGERHG
jgi:rhomboid protease GluP